ncbi:discoidin domain-containing protein [Paenibacillus psychroresistens]|uniref:Discoidin domain-containing protein n=1 Tax=Paenibacillus psychroresistens TaxID=1778678 RepID=A0A6B8RNI5_9BACL|nr:discoidin domain-containing protein [Paenibacillus psychroresistens]QGQ97911.1 discoidin domain-containing protein [Paenibacillus psychroresistens]
MSIKSTFKRSMIATLLTVSIILSMFSTPSRAHAQDEPNLALNTSRSGYPSASASFTCSCDNVWNAVDGSYLSNRWTSYNSTTSDRIDSITVDFGSAKSFNQVKLYIYNDGGGVQTPASYTIQYWDGSIWRDAVNQLKTPVVPTAALYSTSNPAGILNTVNFDTVTSPQIKVIFTSRSNSRSGVVELEVFLYDQADHNAANSIILAIEDLPAAGSITLSFKSAVEVVRSAYNNLSMSQKNLVTNISKFIELEAAIAWLQPPSDPPVSLAFSDFNQAQGTISGTVTLVQPLNRTYITNYSLFWADNTGAKLPNRSAIATTNAVASPTNVTFSISDLEIPPGALKLIAYANNSSGFNPNGAVVPFIDSYDKIPSSTYSSITGTVQEGGSKNVTVNFIVYNAAHEPLKQFHVENFTLNIPSLNDEHWTGLDNQNYFTNFTNHFDGTYSFVYTGAKYGTTYPFKFFTAHYNPANVEEYISIQDTYDVITPINPIVDKINDIAQNASASSISESDLLSVLDDLGATADLIADNLVAYQSAISSSADSALNTATLIHQMVLDINTAAVVRSAIQALFPVESLELSDKSAVAAARSAYDNLTDTQRDFVTNLTLLNDAEEAIAALEAAQNPVMKNINVLSAFSNAMGDTITLKLSSVLDITYNIPATKFVVIANEVSVPIASADYDPADSSHRTIKLTLAFPALLSSTSVTLSVLSGALKTSNNELNNTTSPKPVITFLNLDLSHDNHIGVEDIVLMIRNPLTQIDVNLDQTFNPEDILILLGQISMQ